MTHDIPKQAVPRCPVCDGERREQLFEVQEHEYSTTTDDRFPLKRCLDCTALFLDPRPDKSALDIIYPSNYYTYTLDSRPAPGEGRVSIFSRASQWLLKRRMRPLARHVKLDPDLKWMEIGCSSGLTLDLFRRLFGCQGVGLDFSESAVEGCRRRGFVAHACRIEDYQPAPDERYQLLYSSHLIEHIESPLAFMRKSYELLQPGGYLVIVTPNTDTWEARFFGRNWGALHVPRHWAMLNPTTLPILARLSGLEHVETSFSPNGSFWGWSFHSVLQSTFGRPVADLFFPSDERHVTSSALNVLRATLLTAIDWLNLLCTGRCANMLAIFRRP